LQVLISSFNAKYPDIKVTVEYLDYTNGDDQVNTAIEGGSAPDLIMEGPERLVANWGKKGVMAPLNDLWTDDAKKDIYASVESACRNDAGDYYESVLISINVLVCAHFLDLGHVHGHAVCGHAQGILIVVTGIVPAGGLNGSVDVLLGIVGPQVCTAAPSPMLSTPSTPPTPPRTSRPSRLCTMPRA